jgi:hypothetical protein
MDLDYQNLADIQEKMALVRESLLRSFLHRRNVLDVVNARIAELNDQGKQQTGQQDNLQRVRMERQVREEFEEQLKKKYHFTFVPQNFPGAIKVAKQKKTEQDAVD